MAIPINKEELLKAIDGNFAKLMTDLVSVPEERAKAIEMEGHAKGSLMSVADLVAYLIGWGELVLKWQANKEKGEAVSFPEEGYKWNELGRLAQKFYRDHAHLDYAARLARLGAVKSDIVAMIECCDTQKLYGEPWYESYTLGRMIQLNTASPYANARNRVRRWKRENLETQPQCE